MILAIQTRQAGSVCALTHHTAGVVELAFEARFSGSRFNALYYAYYFPTGGRFPPRGHWTTSGDSFGFRGWKVLPASSG